MTATTQWRHELQQQVSELLGSLGGTPKQVASHLQQAGVAGVPGSVKDCAIACYLSAVLGADRRVRSVKVANRSVSIGTARSLRRLRVRLPRPLQEFIVGFDHCVHPELVRPAVSGRRSAERLTSPSAS